MDKLLIENLYGLYMVKRLFSHIIHLTAICGMTLFILVSGCKPQCREKKKNYVSNEISRLSFDIAEKNPVFFPHGNNTKIDTAYKNQVKFIMKNLHLSEKKDSVYKEFVYVFMLNNYYNDLKFGNQAFVVSFDEPFDKIAEDYKKIFGRNIRTKSSMFSLDPQVRLNYVSRNTLLLKRKIDSLEKALWQHYKHSS